MKLRNDARGVLAALTGLFVLGMTPAQQQISVVVNGRPVQFETIGPIEDRGRVLVPLRGVFEQMGAQVDWDSYNQRVTAAKGGTTIKLNIGSSYAMVNGNNIPLDVPAEIQNGSTMVPLRFISEAMGANVQWSAETSTVDIHTGITSAYRDRPAPTRIRRDGDLQQPRIVVPKENQQVGSPMILSGRGTPYATIMFHVTYSALTTLNEVRVHGTLDDTSVTADRDGHFRIAIDLGRVHGANKRFTVTAWCVDSNGRKSDSTVLNVFE